MTLINTATLTPNEIARILDAENLLDNVKAVEEEVSTITIVKDEQGRKKQWIEETRDLDGFLLSKRIEDHSYLPDGRTDKIVHRIYEGADLRKQWTVDDCAQKIIAVNIEYVREQIFVVIDVKTLTKIEHSKLIGTDEKGNQIFGTYYTTTGKVVPAEGITIILDAMPYGLDAVLSELDENNEPNGEPVLTENGEVVTVSFKITGDFTLSDIPKSQKIALIYMGEYKVERI